MRHWFKISLILLLLGSAIWSCEKANRNPLVAPAASENVGTSSELPKTVILEQPYPNPLSRRQRGEIWIRYAFPQTMHAKLTVENVVGDVVLVLANREHPAGFFTTNWNAKHSDGKPLEAGVYMVHLTTATVSLRKLFEIRD
jgi:hypothetical protein